MSFLVMADNSVDISAKRDGALYNVANGNNDFIIKGLGQEMAISNVGLNVTIASGEAVVHGRHITAEGDNTIQLPPNESGYLVLRIDLSRPVGEEAILFATPSLSQEEINWSGVVYDMPLAQFVTNTLDVNSLIDMRKVTSSVIPTFRLEGTTLYIETL